MRRPAPDLLPLVLLAALACGCFGRLVASPAALLIDGDHPSVDHANRGDPRPIGNDTTFVFLPHHLQVARSIAEFGHVPAWDTSGFGGRPMIGNPQGGLFYPPAWLFWLFPKPALLGWLTVGHLLWGGLGTYLLARGRGLGRWPATVAAGVFQASPYLLAQTFEGHAPHVWSACWFPWAFLAFFELREGRRRGLLALPPILALCALAGHPQEWLLLVLALSAWAACDAILVARRDGRDAAVRLLGWTLALGLGVGLAAIDLLPMLEALPWTARAGGHEAAALPRNHMLHFGSLLQLLSPRALGGPADFVGPDNYWESLLAFGLVPLLLIATGIGASLRRPSRSGDIAARPRGWVALAFASIWFAAGPGLGLFTLLHLVVPGMASFRVPARSLFLMALAAAMLAGIGSQELMNRYQHLKSWKRFAGRLTAVVALLLGGLLAATLASDSSTHTQRVPSALDPLATRNAWDLGQAARRIVADPVFLPALAALVAAVAWGCIARRRTGGLTSAHLVGVLALAELAAQGHALLRVTPASNVLAPDPIAAAIAALPDPEPSGAPPRLRARDSFYLDLPAVRNGLEKTNVNDVFQLGHAAALYEQLYAVASVRRPLPRPSFHMATPEQQRRIRQGVFDRMSVSLLVSDRFEDDPGWPIATQGCLPDGRAFVIQRNPDVLPRAYVVPRAELVPDDAAITLRRFPESDPRQVVLMTADPLATVPEAPRQAFTPARRVGHDPDRPAIEVTTSAPGLLVIADTWMPGWTARLDGRPVPVLRGNHAQRVVPIATSGPHRIVLEYRPPGLVASLWIAAGSALTWLALAASSLRSRRNRSMGVEPVLTQARGHLVRSFASSHSTPSV